MRRYRRIEITAFRRRVMIVSGDPKADASRVNVLVNDAESEETIETSSEEGRAILIEAVRLLEERISQPARDRTARSVSHK